MKVSHEEQDILPNETLSLQPDANHNTSRNLNPYPYHNRDAGIENKERELNSPAQKNSVKYSRETANHGTQYLPLQH